ncbi:MAG: PrsW family glutamic-type intramembrane protease [bacterium]
MEINTKIIVFAIIGGILPSIMWLKFWFKEDKHQEPRGLILKVFLLGMLCVPIAVLFEKGVSTFVADYTFLSFLLWAIIEEGLKVLAAYFPALKTRFADEPIDMVLYMMTAALGFSALENSLFLLGPLSEGNVFKGLATLDFRFIGASLLHILTSGIVGIAMAESFYKSNKAKLVYFLSGTIIAVLLHALFNNFIIGSKFGVMISFGAVWIGIIAIILILEKIKKIKNIHKI